MPAVIPRKVQIIIEKSNKWSVKRAVSFKIERKIYGDSFSRCGKWSRFQRSKAASLVSLNRNFSVGDSTWPSQMITSLCY